MACRLIRLVCSQAPADEPMTLALDDWVIERFSDNAPACRTHHQHSKKTNRPQYIWGQCWVSLAVIFERLADKVFTGIPVISFPAPASGNASKLKFVTAKIEDTSALDALENGWLCVITVGDRLQKLVMSEDFPDTLEVPGYNNRRHDENCPVTNYSKVPHSQGLG